MTQADPPRPDPTLPLPRYTIVRRAPAPALASAVTAIAGYRELAPGCFRQRQPASLDIPLVVSFGAPFRIGLGRAPRHDDTYATFAAGLSDRPVVIDSLGHSHCLQVNFTPLGARRFFGLPMRELTNRMVPLEEIFGSRATELRERLGEMTGWTERFALIEALISSRLEAGEPPRRPGALWAFGQLLASGGAARIEALAERLDCSRKHLVAMFHDDIGLPPKTVARIVRLAGVLQRAKDASIRGWADVAAASGYADQAHLSREFRELVGETPSQWKARAG